MSGLVIRPRARIFSGHDWVYASEILKSWGQPVDGEVVQLKDGRDRLLGSAIYNSQSQIVARRFSRQRQFLDPDFFERRIGQAAEYRKRRGITRDAYRLVWSESDGLPGLVIDRYGPALVVQALTLAMDRRLDTIVEVLQKLFAPEWIVLRNDAPVRRAEGLELETRIMHGPASQSLIMPVTIAGLKFEVDLLAGQKTGFYLDQAENYRAVAAFARGRSVLDCFSNQGAFALACAREGATSVKALDVSGDAVTAIRQNAERNAVSVEAEEVNVFDYLKTAQARGETYDLIILDPPSFTRSKDKVRDAMRGYKEIHLRALQMLSRDGIVATFSCSHHVSTAAFQDMIVEAMLDAKRSVRQLALLGPALDHPILPNLPETEYLKGFVFESAPGR